MVRMAVNEQDQQNSARVSNDRGLKPSNLFLDGLVDVIIVTLLITRRLRLWLQQLATGRRNYQS